MQRARTRLDQTLAAQICRTIAENNRDARVRTNPYRRDEFEVWQLPEFEHESIPVPRLTAADLQAEYDGYQAQFH